MDNDFDIGVEAPAAANTVAEFIASLEAEKRDAKKQRRRDPPPASEPEGSIDDPRPPAFSDDALALRFADQHGGDLRYVAAWGRWYSWTGSLWRADDTLSAYDLVRATCRAAAAECNEPRIATAIASARTVAAVERLAKADRKLAGTIDQWDADPWLLNTPGGVVDLQTGIMRAHRPDDYMTKITAVAPGGDCPLFLKFLDRITGGDGELIAYHRRVLGYALTGITREQALFFGHGEGANGKSVLLSTAAGILKTYHRSAPMETFTASNVDRHPTDLAMLQGARLVTATETEEGRRWAEARIKQLTGDDPVEARFMRQDFFTYKPQFKLFIAGNNKPGLRRVDEAIRRRFHLIPFAVTIPPGERDKELPIKLKAEWPGILAWGIEGCLDWQKAGLRQSQAVRDATAEYLEDEDVVATWIDERCERDPTAWAASSALFGSWASWAAATGEHAGGSKAFSQSLEKRGFRRLKKETGQGFVGLRLKLIGADNHSWEA